MTDTGPKRVDVEGFLDRLALSRFHIVVLVLCTLLTAIDGYELYVVGWVIPKLATDFGVPATSITSAMVLQQIGMSIGAFLVPPLADRIGRARLTVVCYTGMMLSALGALNASTLDMFVFYRFFAGLFGAAMIPIAVTLASETAPTRLRSTFATITVSGTMLGSAIGAGMQAFVLEPYGWRGAFWIAVALPAIIVPLVWLFLPDSMRSLAARNPDDPMIQVVARRMLPAGAVVPKIFATPKPAGTATRAMLRDIFGPGRTLRTLLVWGVATGCFGYVVMSQWKTTIYHQVMGLSWDMIASLNLVNSLAGFAGMFMIGWFIDRFGFKRVLVSTYFLAVACAVLTGWLAPSPSMLVAAGLLGLFQHGGQAGMSALAAAIYPAAHRATGVGWAYAAGRTIAIGAPFVGSAMIAGGYSGVVIFTVLGVPLLFAGICALIVMSLPGAPVVTRANLRH